MLPLFGKIALERGYLTKDQLSKLLGLYGRKEGRVPMGRLALRAKLLTQVQVEEILGLQISEFKRLRGSTLHEQGTLSGEPEAEGVDPALASLLRAAFLEGASDLHLHSDAAPLIRKGGVLVPIAGAEPLGAVQLRGIFKRLVTPPQFARWERELELDFASDIEKGIRVRGNLYVERHGPAACFRLIPTEVPSLMDAGLPSDLARLTTFHNGLVLITGPARCGKSTTLAAMVRLINEDRKHNILIVEDPIEFIHESRSSTVMQREVGPHTRSFAASLRAALREDPDVIVVGELRDLETVSLAVTAAETGHLVLATLHTRNAVETVSRLVDVFPAEQQGNIRSMLAESLRGVVSQVLHPLPDGGYVPVLEQLTHQPAVATCIRDDKLHQLPSIMQTNRRKGMRRFRDSIDELLADGTIDPGGANELYERLTDG